MKKIEILAPAGSKECLMAAINAGCDAVYMGGKKFGARAYASNFEEDSLIESIEYAHLHNVKLYLTVNTLINNDELYDEFYEYLFPYYEAGLDAVIIQDLGLMKFVHENFPEIDIHASTQATLSTHLSANLLKEEFGITRIVPPRELSLKELKNYRSNTDLEMEVFTHGALCYCYSGQCLMSSLFGGRSGNRGRCAQPCRKEYQVNNKKNGYFLSPKDLCALEIIPQLIDCGIDSFKIEGRMKKPEYVALSTYLYKKYTQLSLESNLKEYNKELESDIVKLTDIYNRGGFTKGYLMNELGKDMISKDRPNHYGTLVGEVVQVNKGNCIISASKKINPHDVLEIRGRDLCDTYEFTIKDGKNVNEKFNANVSKGLKLRKSQKVYRMRNNTLIDEIDKSIITNRKKHFINMEMTARCSENMQLFIYDDMGNETTVIGKMVQVAKNTPVSEARIKEQLLKLGNTDFICKNISVICDDNIFIPMSDISELKRNAIESFTQVTINTYKRNIQKKDTNILQEKYKIENPKVTVTKLSITLNNNFEVIDKLKDYDNINKIYVDIGLKNDILLDVIEKISKINKIAVIKLPKVIRYKDIIVLENIINILEDKKYNNHYQVESLEGLSLIKKYISYDRIILGPGLYSFNDYSMSFLSKFSKNSFYPYEVSIKDIKSFKVKNNCFMIYGHIPVMISAQCVERNTSECTHSDKINYLKNDDGDFYAVCKCKFCHNVIYSAKPVAYFEYLDELIKNGVEEFNMEFLHETKEEIIDIINNASNMKINRVSGYLQKGGVI